MAPVFLRYLRKTDEESPSLSPEQLRNLNRHQVRGMLTGPPAYRACLFKQMRVREHVMIPTI